MFLKKNLFFFFFFFLSCYKGQSLRDYNLKNTQECIAQMLTSKTHVQKKQMYVGLHHLVLILYYNQTLCACMRACSQDLKLAVKQALELFTPSSFQSFGIQNFRACSLFSMSLLPRLCCCQLCLLLFMLQLQYKSRKRKRSNSNSKT